MNLSNFLLARLAEDEAAALASDGMDFVPRGYWPNERVLAQVAATRAIVGACRPDYEESLASNDDTTSLAEEVLRHLAAPYASHPDFDPAWVVS